MLKPFVFAAIFIMSLSCVFSLCEENQININSASAEELDKITGIGPAYAEKIIQGRPFASVDELIKISGIGDKTLEKIKQQGLACVDGNTKIEENKGNETDNIVYAKIESNIEEKEKKEISVINLSSSNSSNSKSIKSEDNKENLTGSKYALYGLIALCVVFAFILLLKRRKEKHELQ
ncbi:MAG: helix-hairpin-helix domain-containing protein [Candidatus Pacearchaeota archaeon]|nr:helix-hairpin-helix domain-containing protein [Candidatus Pacearchaeota archaeon]